MRRVALVTALCFGCATARPPTALPVPLAGTPPARVALAEPTLELWMEGTRAADPDETAEALAKSRAALGEALAGRGLEGVDAPDALLTVHARAVARTAERRHAQIASVVAVVAIVAIVVLAVILSRDGSHARRATHAAPVRGGGGRGPGPWRGPAYAPAPSPFFFGWAVGVHVAAPLSPAPPPPAGLPAPPPEPDPILDARGWLDGDEVELVAELVDPRTGELRWRRAVRDGVDPRDARGMTRLVDRLLAGEAFGRKGMEPPPPRPPEPVPGNLPADPFEGILPAPAPAAETDL